VDTHGDPKEAEMKHGENVTLVGGC
jgi:hypothetical protein